MRHSLLTGIFGGVIAPVVILLAAGISRAAGQSVTQPALRAALFTQWAADAAASGPLTICVLEDTAVESALNDLVGGSTINGRAVLISRDARLRACHRVYLGLGERERAASILGELQGAWC